ncbi:TfoX/Sxy family protein [Flavobacterium sp. 3HN19-14]|uniref:TfoX/Sxy family protein n=1 Tax=Flavobacterium sp. 3HN19-14 TaxID=3448133 RepID=UPI003EE2FC1D
MAYNENTVQRIRTILQKKEVDFFEKKMFGGICFMVDEKICCATRIDKNNGEDLLLCRLSETDYVMASKREDAIPMGNAERKMSGFIFISESGFKTNSELVNWIRLCLDFNPFAKASKRKNQNLPHENLYFVAAIFTYHLFRS